MTRKRRPYTVTAAQVGQAVAHKDTASGRSAMAAVEAGNRLTEQHILFDIYYDPNSEHYSVRRLDGA